MLTQRERRNVAIGLAVVAVLLVIVMLTGGGDPGMPKCPKHNPHPTTVECK